MWREPITQDLRRPDPLPSWNEGPVKTAILDFVARVTRPGGPDFVPPDERLATFDNDGTLWTEQPCYVPAGVRRGPGPGAGPRTPGLA